MSEENKIEFTSRGKRQLKGIVYNEVKEIIDPMISNAINRAIERKIDSKLDQFLSRSTLERLVKNRIDNNYSKHYDEMLQKANFQDKLTDEIVEYLHKKWGYGGAPFDEEFEKAMMKAVKKLIRG